MKENNNRLGKPRRSLIRLIKKIDDVNSIVDIMSIKGTGVVVNKPQWFKEFEEKNDKRWEEQRKFNEQQQEFNQYVLDVFKRNNLK